MPDQITDTPKRYQCRHIFTDGHRCGSPCLRGEALCYYHHTTRRPIANPADRRARTSTFHLPLPEDRSAIQSSIGEILQRIAANAIDPKRAGLLLYGLQIASLNLPKDTATPHPQPTLVEEIETHSELGTLAPQTELRDPNQRSTSLSLLLESLRQLQTTEEEHQSQTNEPQEHQPQASEPPHPTTLPTLQASADAPHPRPSAQIRGRSHTPRPHAIPPFHSNPKPRHLDRTPRSCRRTGQTRSSTPIPIRANPSRSAVDLRPIPNLPPYQSNPSIRFASKNSHPKARDRHPRLVS